MKNLLQDLRYGFRAMLKYPGFTAVAVIALALGTGANTAIFSVVNAILLRPLPYGNPDSLVMVWEVNKKSNVTQGPLSLPDFLDYREQNQVFERITSYAYEDFNLSGSSDPEHVQGSIVTANFFSTLGVNMPLGRGFLDEEDMPGERRVLVISYGLWQRRFGADPNILGKPAILNGGNFTIVGVTPREFRAPDKGDEIWVPLSMDGSDQLRTPQVVDAATIKNRSRRFLTAIARLKPDVELRQAQADMSTIAARIRQEFPTTSAEAEIGLVPMHEQVVGNIRPALLFLLAAVIFVLLIACANVANLLLARATVRQKEVAIRTALGASRSRLIRQLLTESVLLALVGGAFGLMLAYAGIKLLVALNPANIPRLNEIGIDGRVLGFTLLISLLTGVIFGLVPALQASKPNLHETLKEGGRSSTGGAQRNRVRSLLVISELALAQILLIGAGLMIKSFYSLQNIDPGFNAQNVLTMQVSLPSTKYSENNQILAFHQEALRRIAALPGVQSVGAVTTLPLTDSNIFLRFTIEGRPPESSGEQLRANFRAINDAYFRAMGIRLLKGRAFTEQDREGSPAVIIINETMRRRYWPNEDPLGKRINIPLLGGAAREIVGVIADIKHSKLDAESGAEMYVPFLQSPWSFMSIVARTALDPVQIAPAVRSEILAIDNSQAIYNVKTLEQLVSDSISQPRLYMILLTIFACVALILAAAGIYGVMSYSVTQRTHEIGLRMALGAQPGQILKLIVGQGMIMALIGVAIGVIGAIVSTIVLSSQISGLLYSVNARDLTTFAVISALLALIAFLSSYIPARRAVKVDPMVALRYE